LEVFQLFDIDGGGSITADEIKKVLGHGAGAANIDDSEWEKIIDEADEDGNGEIDFEEFKAMVYKLLGYQAPLEEEGDVRQDSVPWK